VGVLVRDELQLITDALIKGQANRVKTLTQIAIESGISPSDIVEKALIPGMGEIGRKFRENFIFISDVLIASRAMHAGLHVLKPYLSESKLLNRGKIVIGTVAGDLHDIGKNLVVMMLRGAGFEVVDLGVDVEPEDFAEAVLEHEPEVVGMSAMLTTTLNMIPETIRELERRNVRNQVKVIIGGGPTTKDFSRAIKADGYAVDAPAAVDLVKRLLAKDNKM